MQITVPKTLFDAARKPTTWAETADQCFAILNTKREPARAWWMALDRERRAAVCRAEVVPFVNIGKAWDELPDSAQTKLVGQHEKRRRIWALLNAEFAGRVEA